MTAVLLVLALAASAAPDIHVDEDGFVTITEDSLEQRRDQHCMQLMKEAEEYYNNGDYEDISLAIEKYERVFNSGGELAENVHLSILYRLSMLYQRYASDGSWQNKGNADSLWADWKEISKTGNIPDEFIQHALTIVKSPEYKEALTQAITCNNEAIALLQDNGGIRLARLYFTNADLCERVGDRCGKHERIINYIQARQTAREVIRSGGEGKPEAKNISRMALKNTLLLLQREWDVALASQLLQDYREDHDLFSSIQQILQSKDKTEE
ncbi:MAG: hypothetical protein KAH38_08820 [Candidatus Hydrogenedentes bacterium]|nr:hypothetical protein [Candidatus Hydrogenedentota bacterium]